MYENCQYFGIIVKIKVFKKWNQRNLTFLLKFFAVRFSHHWKYFMLTVLYGAIQQIIFQENSIDLKVCDFQKAILKILQIFSQYFSRKYDLVASGYIQFALWTWVVVNWAKLKENHVSSKKLYLICQMSLFLWLSNVFQLHLCFHFTSIVEKIVGSIIFCEIF